jgi:L-threonylcarbamoyladenylate synthase
MTEIITLDPVRPDPAIARAGQVVKGGGIIVYPTETFYALGVDPRSAEAIQRLFAVKAREAGQPILLLLHEQSQVSDWASEVTLEAEDLMKQYWPGPLTLVFKARKNILSLLTGGRGTIGLRVPGNAMTRRILGILGPLTGTSANLTGEQSLRTAGQAAAVFGDRVDLILDGGTTPGGKPSTVADISTGRLNILRRGAVTISDFKMKKR